MFNFDPYAIKTYFLSIAPFNSLSIGISLPGYEARSNKRSNLVADGLEGIDEVV